MNNVLGKPYPEGYGIMLCVRGGDGDIKQRLKQTIQVTDVQYFTGWAVIGLSHTYYGHAKQCLTYALSFGQTFLGKGRVEGWTTK